MYIHIIYVPRLRIICYRKSLTSLGQSSRAARSPLCESSEVLRINVSLPCASPPTESVDNSEAEAISTDQYRFRKPDLTRPQPTLKSPRPREEILSTTLDPMIQGISSESPRHMRPFSDIVFLLWFGMSRL